MRVGLCGVTIVVMSENVRKLVGVVAMAALVVVGVAVSSGDDTDFTRNTAFGVPKLGGGLDDQVQQPGDAEELASRAIAAAVKCEADRVLISTGDRIEPWRCGPLLIELTPRPNGCGWLRTWHHGFGEMVSDFEFWPEWQQERMIADRAQQDQRYKYSCIASSLAGMNLELAVQWLTDDLYAGVAIDDGPARFNGKPVGFRLITDPTGTVVIRAQTTFDGDWLDRNHPMGG